MLFTVSVLERGLGVRQKAACFSISFSIILPFFIMMISMFGLRFHSYVMMVNLLLLPSGIAEPQTDALVYRVRPLVRSE